MKVINSDNESEGFLLGTYFSMARRRECSAFLVKRLAHVVDRHRLDTIRSRQIVHDNLEIIPGHFFGSRDGLSGQIESIVNAELVPVGVALEA